MTLRTEFLILIPDDEAFCSTKKTFVDFLKIDALISVAGQKITFRRSPKAKELVSARFRVETDKVKSNKERYFLLALECAEQNMLDEFSELSERLKAIAERISPNATTVNTLWDGVGRQYAERAYPVINEVENLMRRLITKFMLITVGVNWSKDAINPELFKKIENFGDDEPYLSDLYKLDFIHLSHVLFERKRDISLDEMDRILAKTKFNEEDKEKILKYVPRSNWEKYFSSLIEEKDHSLERKWELLYKLRNKVAHNRNVKKSEFEQIKGLASDIKDIIAKASAKLGEIDLNEEDRELIIYSYQSESPAALGFAAEKAVGEYYAKAGYEIDHPSNPSLQRLCDFVAIKDSKAVAVEVKSFRAGHFGIFMKMSTDRQMNLWSKSTELDALSKIHMVVVIRNLEIDDPVDQFHFLAEKLSKVLGEKFEIHLGRLNEENAFVPLPTRLESTHLQTARFA